MKFIEKRFQLEDAIRESFNSNDQFDELDVLQQVDAIVQRVEKIETRAATRLLKKSIKRKLA